MTAKRPRKAPAKAGATLSWDLSDEKYMAVVEGQRAYFLRLADAIAAGETLDGMGRGVVAAVLRKASSDLPDKPPRRRGQAPQYSHADVALEFAAMTRNPNNPMKDAPAIEALAEKYGVTIESIKGAIKKYGGAADALLDSFGARRKT